MYEGEGTVIYGANHTASLRVKISSTDPDVLYLMKERSRCGNVYGPWKPNGFGIKPYFEWIVNGFDAVAFLTTIRPWLGQRRRARADEKIALWRTRPQRKTNPEVRALIRQQRRDGDKLRVIAERHGLSFGYVSHICTGRAHPEEVEAEAIR
jgi:hypothetical protein